MCVDTTPSVYIITHTEGVASTHTRARTYTHSRIHSHTNTCTHAHTYTHTLTRTHKVPTNHIGLHTYLDRLFDPLTEHGDELIRS